MGWDPNLLQGPSASERNHASLPEWHTTAAEGFARVKEPSAQVIPTVGCDHGLQSSVLGTPWPTKLSFGDYTGNIEMTYTFMVRRCRN